MTTLSRPSRLTAVSLAFGLSVAAAVLPVRAESNRDKVLAITTQALKANGAKEVTFGKVDGDDARFTVSDMKVVTEAEGKTATVTAATSVWTNAVPTPDGGYTADAIEVTAFAIDAEDGRFKADRIAVSKYVGQAPAKIQPGKLAGERIEHAEANGITVTTEDGKSVPVASVTIDSGDYLGDVPRRGAFAMKGLVVPLDPQDPDSAQVRELGYDKVSLDVSVSGTWDDKTGRVEIPALTVSAADMGSARFSLTIGGLTPAVAEALRKAEGDQDKQMELLQSLTIEKIALRWDDGSLAGRLLATQAKQQGVDAKTYAKQLKLMLPPMLSMIGNKDFEKKVAGAAGAFLDAPKSLTVSATPKQPLPVAQIMGAAMMAPQSLPTVLGADVSAND